MLSKAMIRSLDGAALLIVSAIFAAFTPTYAYAYVDPSVMTYTIQALAGVAVALSTVIGVVWRRARRKVYSKLNIDENKHKLVEPAVKRTSGPNVVLSTEAQQFQKEAHRSLDEKFAATTFRKRLIAACLISTFATFTLLVTAPFEMVAANEIFLLFTLGDIALPVFLGAAIIDIALIAVLLLFRGKAFRVACAIVFAFGLCCYSQVVFMNFTMPAADGHKIDWENYWLANILSALVWISIFVAVIGIGVKSTWQKNRLLPIIAAALIFIQGAGVASLFIEKAGHDRPAVITEEGLFELAPKNNVVMFVLDTADNNDVLPLIENNPESFKEFSGFTVFTDVSPTVVPTRYGVPFLLTGELPRKDEAFKYYVDDRYKRSHLIKDIANNNYSVDIFTDSLFNGVYELRDQTRNLHPLDNLVTEQNAVSVVSALWRGALYRDMTWIFKPYFWFYTDQWNNSLDSGRPKGASETPYKINDPKFYKKLQEKGLSIEEGMYIDSADATEDNIGDSGIVDNSSKNKKGAFKFIHLLGSHEPYVMDENAKPMPRGEESDAKRQTLGAFKIVSDYIEQIKKLGLYDDTTIIVTSDHGVWYKDPPIGLEHSSSPIIFVKPSADFAKRQNLEVSTTGETLTFNDNSMSHASIIPTMLAALDISYDDYGANVFEIKPNDDVRYYYLTCLDNGEDSTIIEYAIKGDVLDFENWELTGFQWKAH